MASVTVLGSLNVDNSVSLARFPEPGETVAAQTFEYLPGGKGLNQAVAAARMGAHVTMVGAVGADPLGQDLIRQLSPESNLDLSRVRHVNDAITGQAIVMTERGGENEIVVIAGANGTNDERSVEQGLLGLRAGDVLVCQLEIPLAAVMAGLQVAKGHGAQTILNAAPAAHVE